MDRQIRIDVVRIIDCDWAPDEGYVIVCDETNNPPSVIDNGFLNVDIFIGECKG